MNLIENAYVELFSTTLNKSLRITYSGRFKAYNANIRMNNDEIVVNMSKQWRTVSPDIKKGLIQELLVRLFKVKKHTLHIDLYNNFIKSLPKVIPQTLTHPVLEESFSRVNNQFFNGMMVAPNLTLGKGVNRLGTYEYATDTVAISEHLLEHPNLLDYVMYHELLHKKHQFTAKHGRARHHSRQFRHDERQYPNSDNLEKQLEQLVRRKKLSQRIHWF